MKLATGTFLMFWIFAQFGQAQTNNSPSTASTESLGQVTEPTAVSFAVIGATRLQEATLRTQIRLMHPEVLPLRVCFVPHWKYLDAARIFHLHLPTGYGSLMFTHLASRTIFIDNDRYLGEDWLGDWIAHELGHLATNSAKEEDAEKAARQYRKRLARRARQTEPY